MKEKNKKIIIGISLGIILVLIAIIILFITNKISLKLIEGTPNNSSTNNQKNDKNQNEEIDTVAFKIDSKTIAFYERKDVVYHIDNYSNETEISKYECTNQFCGYCNAYTVCQGLGMINNNVHALYDYNVNDEVRTSDDSYYPSKIVLWNAIDGKEIASYNDIIETYSLIKNDGTNEIKYIILKNKNNIISLYDTFGNYITDVSKKQYIIAEYEGKRIDESSYLVETDMIVTKKGEKQGIESITGNKTLVNYEYDEIRLHDDFTVRKSDNIFSSNYKLYSGKYFKARNGNKWTLYNLSNGNQVINKEYDKLYLLDEKNIAVYNNGYISFVDYSGNKISNDNIEVSNLFAIMPKNPEGIIFTISDSIVKISISDGTSYKNLVNYSYEYNLETKKVTKIN